MEGFAAKCPPSDTRPQPVINEDWSEAKNITACAISSPWPILPIGSFSKNAFIRDISIFETSIPIA